MKYIKSLGLFLSSFIPLFILLIIKEIIEIINGNWTFNTLNTIMIILLVTFIFMGIIAVYAKISELKKRKKEVISIVTKQNITDQHFLGYFSIFVLFAVTFEMELVSMAVLFIFVLTFIAIVYIKNDMYYINPFLNMLGYSFYDIEYYDNENKTNKVRAFFKGRVLEGESYYLQNKKQNMSFLTNIKK